MSIGNGDAAEFLQNSLERLLWDVLKPFAKISQREFKLGWHSVQADKRIEVDQRLHSLHLFLFTLRPGVLVSLFSNCCDESAQVLLQHFFVLLLESFSSVLVRQLADNAGGKKSISRIELFTFGRRLRSFFLHSIVRLDDMLSPRLQASIMGALGALVRLKSGFEICLLVHLVCQNRGELTLGFARAKCTYLQFLLVVVGHVFDIHVGLHAKLRLKAVDALAHLVGGVNRQCVALVLS